MVGTDPHQMIRSMRCPIAGGDFFAGQGQELHLISEFLQSIFDDHFAQGLFDAGRLGSE